MFGMKNKLINSQKVEVLISAMHLYDTSIIKITNIQSDVVLINQCDIDEYKEVTYENSTVKYLSTTERGLSKSRNKALELATGEICLICDDDEYLYEGYQALILKAYSDVPDADIIAFKFEYPGKTYGNKRKKIGYLDVPALSSIELTFKRNSIIDSKVWFDTFFGSGSVYSAGEENMFLYDCLRKGLKIYYVPVEIGKLTKGSESMWFNGYNEKYFFDKGAWLAGCFPVLKHVLIFYVVFRFRKISEINLRVTFKYLRNGMGAFKSKLSFKDYYEKIKL
jgi:glycosyltransferase involved in cell wall biosynthesis